ncbi:MAG: glycosyltransferase family 1 protein, partial [Flavobacterium sp.]
MNRIFIVYYDFSITSGNHAGMTHLVKLVSKQVQEVRPIKSISHNFRGGTLVAVIYACCLAVYFRFILKRGDKVIFFEYLTKGIAHQSLTAYLMRKLGITSPILALIHLSGDHLLELYGSKEKLIEKLKPIDKAVVFGSSLAKFIKSIGFEKEIVTTFHYADTDFYKPAANSKSQCELNVICMGGLKRNFRSLRRIIEAVPEIKFHVLMGKSELKPIFGDLKNVALYSYMSENDMFRLMKGCDASLSVLEDTIGSNVITSSMATGLIQIVSDVGSIRDYCSNDDSFLCTK